MAAAFGPNALGVVLTGMGSDGLRGAEELVAAGAHVVAQDEATSVVWGMPGFVVNAGLADAVVSARRHRRARSRARAQIGRRAAPSGRGGDDVMLPSGDFDYIRDLVYRRTSIVLEPGKEYLALTRLDPVAREAGMRSVAELVARPAHRRGPGAARPGGRGADHERDDLLPRHAPVRDDADASSSPS